MTMPKPEADALRQCWKILSPHLAQLNLFGSIANASQRNKFSMNVENLIHSNEWPRYFDSYHASLLFYPNDPQRAEAMETQMAEAMDAGELTHDVFNVSATDLAGWKDCPPVPLDSPLRFWLPSWMHEQEPTAAKVAALLDTNQSGGNWVSKCPPIAQELGEKRLKEKGTRQINASNICDDVAEELALDPTTHGKQGPRGADNVRVEGLKGWKFIPPEQAKKVD